MADELQLALLGNVEIGRDGAPVPGFSSSKAQALLCYLAVTGRPQTRPVLAGLLWGDMPEDKARMNLRKALTNLRRLVGPHLDITRQAAALNRDSAYWLDVEVFEDRIGESSTQTDIRGLCQAVELYRGDFLEGFYVRQALAFEEWALAEQARLRNLALGALHRLVVFYAGQGRAGLPDGINYAGRLLALEPWREETHRQLMLLLARSGQRGAALAQYETCRRVLAEELGVEPGTETVALVRAIEEDHIQPDAPQVGTGAATETRPITKAATRPRFRTSLVGRELEMETLRRVWGRVVEDKGQVVLVEGEPGIGKTRLIEELLAEVAEDATILRTKCPDLQNPLPYTLFVDPLRQALSAGRPPGLTDTWLAEVGRLLPELHDLYPDLPQPAQLEAGAERRRLFDAVCTTLLALTNGGSLALFTDDLQWADAASLELLNHLSGWIGRAPVLIIGAYRPHEVGTEHPLQRSRQDWQRTGLLTSLSLGTLSEVAMAQLLQELTTWTGQDPTFGELIHRETGGHPLFVVETVASLRDEGRLPEAEKDWSCDSWTEPWLIPAGVQAVIERRLQRLDELSRRLITAASVMRGSFGAGLAQAVAEYGEPETIEGLERLLASGLLVESGEDRFNFSHDKVREVAYGSLSRMRRKQLHRCLAETVEQHHQGREATVADRLAHHYEQAGVLDKSLEYHLQAGDTAREQLAYEAAISHYQKALAYLKSLGDRERSARVLMQLGLTYHTLFDFERASQAYQEGFVLWQRAEERGRSGTSPPPALHPLRVQSLDPISLDSAFGGDSFSSDMIDQLFSGLAVVSSDGQVVPDVARSWEVSGDGREYLFHLRDDVRWGDGCPVTARDFEYAWKRVLDPGTGAPRANLFYDIRGAQAYHSGQVPDPDRVGVRVLDDFRLAVELDKPTGYFPIWLAAPWSFPVPRHLVEAQGRAWAEPGNIVGNGPFRLQAWERGQAMVLARNPDYHGRFTGNLERVELALIRDSSASLAAYEDNRLDILNFLGFPPVEIERARQRHAGEYIQYPAPLTYYFGFRISFPPFDDVRVRRAFGLAIDKESLANLALRGLNSPATGGLVPPGLPGHSPGIGLPFDPEQARQLLAEAGYPDGRGFPSVNAVRPSFLFPHTDYARSSWRENLGVEIAWQDVDFETLDDELLHGERPMLFAIGWVADFYDPDYVLRVGVQEHQPGWRNETYDDLIELSLIHI